MQAWIDSVIAGLSGMIAQTGWLAPLIALAAGVLTSFTPCSLSTVPLIVGYVGGTAAGSTGRAFRLSLVFAGGMAVTFTALGAAAALMGRLIGNAGRIWYLILGVLMVLMALQTWEIYNFIPSTYLTSRNTRRGYVGALLAGILGGVFSSPCATPMLVVLLGIVASRGSLGWGVALLLLYSLGNSFLVIVAGTSYGFVRKVTASDKYGKFNKVYKGVTGFLILMLGFYMFYTAF
ncbi:cytochrome c biogenesis protein CcdA [Ruminococcaceae bacterium OttesenSCG-928-L11]|nr:cytochrome c biogenesis protein CcdA [Ruminococcaceae bacterium OttesenSCG-928-L11]